jgi:hypothetical protein
MRPSSAARSAAFVQIWRIDGPAYPATLRQACLPRTRGPPLELCPHWRLALGSSICWPAAAPASLSTADRGILRCSLLLLSPSIVLYALLMLVKCSLCSAKFLVRKHFSSRCVSCWVTIYCFDPFLKYEKNCTNSFLLNMQKQ